MQTLIRENEDLTLFHYHNFRSQGALDPPASLFPLFYHDKNAVCVMTNFIVKHVEFFQNSIYDFFQRISNRRALRNYVFEFYFSRYKDTIDMDMILRSDGESLAKALAYMCQIVEDINPFINMVYHFNDIMDDLVLYMHTLIPAVEVYHTVHRSCFKKTVTDFIHDNMNSQVKRICYDNDSCNLNEQTYSVSLIAQYVIVRRSTHQKSPFAFLLGCDSISLLSHAIDYRYVTIPSMLKTLGSDLKLDILKELSTHDLSLSQLAQSLHIPKSSLIHHVNDFLKESAIVKINLSDDGDLYHLNAEYFYRARSTFCGFIDTLMNELFIPFQEHKSMSNRRISTRQPGEYPFPPTDLFQVNNSADIYSSMMEDRNVTLSSVLESLGL